MPQLVRLPGGLVRVPDGVSQEEIIRVATERGLDKPRNSAPSDSVTQAPPELVGRSTSGLESPRPEQSEFAKGVSVGTDSLQGSLYGLAALVGDSANNKELTNWGLENYQRNVDEAGRTGLAASSLDDINDIGSFFDFASGAIGQAVPSLASSAAGAGIGGVVGRTVAKRAVTNLVSRGMKNEVAEKAVQSALKDPAQRQLMMTAMKRGAVSGAFVASAGQQQGALYTDLKEAGIEDAVAPAWAFGAGMGALDIVGEVALAKRLVPGQVEKQLQESLLRGFAKGTGRQAAIEGGTEAAQSGLGSMARILNGEDESWTTEDTKALRDNAASGAIVGAVLGAPASLAERAQQRKPASEKQSVRREPAQAPAQPAASQRVEQPLGAAPVSPPGANTAVPAPDVRSPVQPVGGQPGVAAASPAVTDAPSAEPAADIDAQMRDAANNSNPRKAVYLSAANIEQHSDRDTPPGLVKIKDADGKGGVLYIRADARAEFTQRLRAGEPRESIIGSMTLSGSGKQPGADTVVQQKDGAGAVTRETLVPAAQAPLATVEMQAPGRTVEAVSPDAALQRREQMIAMDDLSIPGSVQQVALVEQLRSVLPDNVVGRDALQWVIDNNQLENIGKARDAGRSTYQLAAAVIARAHGVTQQGNEATPRQRLAMRDIQNLLAQQREAEADTAQSSESPEISEAETQDAGLTGSEAERPYRRIGAGDRMDGAVLPGRGRIQANPFSDQASAETVARKRQESDQDATYVAEETPDGWFVNVYARPAAEAVFNMNAGGPATVEQLTRLYIARASRRWDNLPRNLKEGKGKTYGFKGVYVDAKNQPVEEKGKARTVNLASTEIVELGLAIDPDLRKAGAIGLRDAFRLGLSHLMSREQDRIVPLSWTKEKPSFPRNLVLREERGGLAEVTLGDAQRIAQQRATVETTAATAQKASARSAETSDVLPEGVASRREHGPRIATEEEPLTQRQRLALQAGKNLNLASTDPRDVTPAFERRSSDFQAPGEPESFDQSAQRDGDTRPFETEEAQNRRSTNTFAPGGSVGTAVNRGDSAIGSVSAGRAGTYHINPPQAPFNEGLTPRGDLRVDAARAEQQARQRAANASGSVKVLMHDPARVRSFTGMVKALRDILKLRKDLVVSDDKDMFIRALREAGFDNTADAIADKIDGMPSNNHAFVVRSTGGTKFIFLNPLLAERNRAPQAFKSLSHEIGHVFFEQYWGDTKNETRKALIDAFETFLEKNPKFRENLNYEQRFEEWMADQIAAWVASDAVPRNAVEQWFKDLAALFKKIWAAIQQSFPLDSTVQEYINETLRTFDAKVDPAFDSLGGANSLFRDDMDAPVREPSPKLRELWTKARAMKAKHKTIGSMLDFVGESAMAMHNGLTASLHARIRRMNIPAFTQIVSHFHHRAGEVGGFTFDTAVANRIRNFSQQYDTIVAKVGDKAGFLEALRSERTIDQMPKGFQEAAAQMRILLRRLYEYQVEAGLPIQEVHNYFPQVGDVAELTKPDAVDTIYEAIQRAGVKWNTSSGEIEITRAMVKGWVENLGDDTYTVDFDPARLEDVEGNVRTPFVQALRARSLQPQVRAVIRDIKDDKGQARFYAKNMDEVLHRYARQAARRAEYNRLFGEDVRQVPPPETGQPPRTWNPHAKFKALIDEAREQGADPSQQELMYDSMSAFMGNYQRIRSEPLKKLTKSVAFYQNLRTLLWVTISSFPEFTTLFLRTGNFGDTWRTIRASAADAWRKGGDTSKLLRAYGFAVDELDALAFKEFYDARDYDSKINRLNESWFRAIGLTRWTNFMRGLSMNVSIDYMKEHASRIAGGLDTDGDSQRRLDELGVSVDDLRAWAAADEPVYGQAGVTLEDQHAGRSDHSQEQLEAIQRVTGAVTRMINEIVVNPTAAMKPLWRSSERWALVTQLGSFTYGFLNQVLGRVWYELNRTGAPTMARAAPLIALAMMIPLVALGLELKELFQYRLWGQEPRTDGMSGPEYIRTLIARTGVLGVAQLGVDAYESASFGRDPIGVLTGPTVSQVNSAFRNIAQAEDTSRAVLKTTLGAIPFLSSTPGARDLLMPAVER